MARSYFTILVAVIVLVGGGTAAADLTDGLIAYYPFNGNPNDETGNGHDGTVYGATLTIDRFGNANSAYKFDGTDDYIEASNPAAFGFHNESFTVSVWGLVIENRPVYESFVGLGSASRQYCVNKWRDGLRFYTEFDSGYKSQAYYYYNGDHSPIPPGTWIHLVSVVNCEIGKLQLYGDGQFKGYYSNSSCDLIDFDFSSGTILRFGMRPGYGNYLLGAVDDVRIYNRALSASEIHELYVIPAPSAAILGSIGIAFSGWLFRRRKTL